MNLWITTQRFLLLMACWATSHAAFAQISLPWTEDFESAVAGSYSANTNPIPGLSGAGYHWRYEAALPGSSRLRTNAAIAYNSGTRAITLDNQGIVLAQNDLILTADMSDYALADDLELSFFYMIHGDEPNPEDSLWVRGDSTSPWIPVYWLVQGFGVPANGVWLPVTAIDLDAVLAANGQMPTASFQVRFGQMDDFDATGTGFTDGLTFDDVSITGTLPVPDNAGVIQLLQPSNPFSGTGLQPVQIRIKNFGVDTLYSVSVDWEFNGIPQPLVIYPGLPIYPGDEANMTMGNINMTVGNSFDFRFWTTQPNGNVDQDMSNDTLETTICRGLSGVYTVGTLASDYHTIQDALDALYNCTVVGPVVFNLAPGTYNYHWHLTPVPGASAVNTITFDGADTTTTTLTHDGTGSIGNATILLDGADYITFRNFRIANTGTATAFGVHLTNGANWNTIENNRIVAAYVTGVQDLNPIVFSGDYTDIYAEGSNAHYNLIQHNIITGGSESIHIEGADLAENNGNRILDNLLANAQYTGVYADDQDSIEIVGNVIYDIIDVANGDGIYTNDLMNYIVSANNVRVPNYPLYIFDGNANGAHARRGLISNNMLISTGDAAIYADGVEDTDIWHNSTIGVQGFFTNDPVTLDIQNNIFVGTTGVAFESADNFSMTAMNFNIYHKVSGANLIKYGTVNYASLALWQAAAFAYDANSRSGNPNYINTANNLHVLGTLANDAASAVNVTTDIDGENRPMGVASDIGADEYSPYAVDGLAVQLLQPTANICGDSFQTVEVVVSNLGTSAITNMTVNVDVTGATTQSISTNYSGNLLPNTTATVVVGTINTYAGGYFTFNIYTVVPGEQNVLNDTLTLTVGISPSSPLVGLNDTVCVGLPATLSTQPAPGVSLQWFNAPSGGSSIATGNTYTTGALTTNATYYVEPLSLVSSSLLTTTAGGNGQSGAMFDITATNTVVINGFTARTTGTGTMNFQIYYKAGTATGFTTNAGAWTLAGAAAVAATPGNVPIPIALAVTIPAGQTYAFYVTNTGTTPNVVYSNGTALGAVFASDANIQFKQGYGKGYPFAADFSPRVWNGTIHYSTGSTSCNNTRVPVEGIVVNPTPVNLGADTTICSSQPLVLDAQLPNGTYVWSTNATSQQVSVSNAGTYHVRVIDAYGCFVRDTIVVSTYPNASVTASETDALCNGSGDGTAGVTVSGGVGGFTYLWNNNETTASISGLAPGNYTVSITDLGTGCHYTAMAMVDEPALLTATTNGVEPSCSASGDGMASVTALGGNGSYTYLWNTGETTATITGLNNGSYTVTVSDANGCDTVVTHVLAAPSSVAITLDSLHDEGVSIGGGIYISVGGGVAPYNVLWNNGVTTEDLTGVVAATYTVVVMDANGCTDTATFTVNYTIPLSQTAMEAGVQQIALFPNPTNGLAQLQVNLVQSTPTQVDILDMSGRLLQSLQPQTAAQQLYLLDLTNFSGGVYTVRLIVKEAVITQKLVLTN